MIKRNIHLLIGIIFLFIFIVYVYLVAYKDLFYDISVKGKVGDAIGGITAPIIGLTGAILIYISFLEQVKANRLLLIQNEFSLLISLINELKKDIQMLFEKKWKDDYTIKDYLKNLLSKKNIPTDIGRHFNYVLSNYLYVSNRIEESKSNQEEKDILLGSLYLLYQNYLNYYCARIARNANSKTKSEIKNDSYSLSVELVKLFTDKTDDAKTL